jgi:hypothetical protein
MQRCLTGYQGRDIMKNHFVKRETSRQARSTYSELLGAAILPEN